MIEPVTLLKSLGGLFKDIYVIFAKRFAQPKLEIKIVKVFRNRVHIKDPATGYERLMPVYEYKIAIVNNSEHNAYHLKIIDCNVVILEQYIDYLKPVFTHDYLTSTLYIKDNNTEFFQAYELGKGPNLPPIDRLVIEYANSKGKRFTTEFSPGNATEEQNTFDKVR